jgi:hypothetical protein
MSNVRVKVNQSPQINVRVGQQPAVKIVSNANSPLRRYVDLIDVDTSNLQNGDIAVYNSTTEKFVSQSNLTLTNLSVNNTATFNGPVNFGTTVHIELDGGIY